MKNTRLLQALVLIISGLLILFFLSKIGFNKGTKVLPNAGVSSGYNAEDEERKAYDKLSSIQQEYLQSLALQGNDDDTIKYRKLAGFWDSIGRIDISAWYRSALAERFPTPINLTEAGANWVELFGAGDSSLRSLAAERAMITYRRLLDSDTANINFKAMLAWAIVQNRNRVMEGVTLLREVQAVDSNNVPSLYMLGLLSLESGQYELAVKRFKKLLSLQPFNREYPLLYAQALHGVGKGPEAREFLEKLREASDDEVFRGEIGAVLRTLK